MILKKPYINTYYRPEMVYDDVKGTSRSPQKPRLFMEHVAKQGFSEYFPICNDFQPFVHADFFLAHEAEYVEAFFSGEEPLCRRSGINWSPAFAESVRYTNASLYSAIRQSCLQPDQLWFSPTSGFHHADPGSGNAFCAFSGQVIAAVKLYREFELIGAWIDLDGHFGNSIPDSYEFVPDLETMLPSDFQINPPGKDYQYYTSLRNGLNEIERGLLEGEIDYVVLSHGADSHEWDDLGWQCTTENWINSGRAVYEMIQSAQEELGRPVPFSMALFGGYREDDYESVLELHLASLLTSLDVLAGKSFGYRPAVKRPKMRLI